MAQHVGVLVKQPNGEGHIELQKSTLLAQVVQINCSCMKVVCSLKRRCSAAMAAQGFREQQTAVYEWRYDTHRANAPAQLAVWVALPAVRQHDAVVVAGRGDPLRRVCEGDGREAGAPLRNVQSKPASGVPAPLRDLLIVDNALEQDVCKHRLHHFV